MSSKRVGFYEGDVLRVYAICAPVLLVLRKHRPRTLAIGGTLLVISSALLAFAVGPSVGESGEELGEFWFVDGVASLVLIVWTDFDPRWALPAHGLNTLATIPMALGYIGAITRWNRRSDTALHLRFRAVGRTALTNYLLQSVLGITIVALVLPDDSGRFVLLGVVVVIWPMQLAWSQPWLARFTMGPAEWLWRLATYRRVSPIRR